MSFTIRGDMTVHDLRVTLTDGRIVTLHPNGSMYVRAGEHDSNEYTLDLPTLEEISQRCDPAGDGEVLITAYHLSGH